MKRDERTNKNSHTELSIKAHFIKTTIFSMMFAFPFACLLFFSLSPLPSMTAAWFSLPQTHPPVSLHTQQAIFLRHWTSTSHFTYCRHTQLLGLWGSPSTSFLSTCPSNSQATYWCVPTSTLLAMLSASPQWGENPSLSWIKGSYESLLVLSVFSQIMGTDV